MLAAMPGVVAVGRVEHHAERSRQQHDPYHPPDRLGMNCLVIVIPLMR